MLGDDKARRYNCPFDEYVVGMLALITNKGSNVDTPSAVNPSIVYFFRIRTWRICVSLCCPLHNVRLQY